METNRLPSMPFFGLPNWLLISTVSLAALVCYATDEIFIFSKNNTNSDANEEKRKETNIFESNLNIVMHTHIEGDDGIGGEGDVFHPVTDNHSYSLIFLHGLNRTSKSWIHLVEDFSNSDFHRKTRYVFPTARKRNVGICNNEQCTAWFDILAVDVDAAEDSEGIDESVCRIHKIIENEVRLLEKSIESKGSTLPLESRILLGGFSQGGALAIRAGLLYKIPLGGIIVLSSWLPLRYSYNKADPDSAEAVSIFWGHGQDDKQVLVLWGWMSVKMLTDKLHYKNLSFNLYRNVGHATCQEEMEDVEKYISGRTTGRP